jgi:hypothetical protein
MDAVAEQGVLFPVIEQKARRRSALRDYMDALDRHGPLLPRAMVPLVLDVSRQRVKELVDADRIASIVVHGREFVPIAALEMFLAEERKVGRPVRELSLVESYRTHVFGSRKKAENNS